MTSILESCIIRNYYKSEDWVVRKFQQLPKKHRIDSYPYLSPDTFALRSNVEIDNERIGFYRVPGGIYYIKGDLVEDFYQQLRGEQLKLPGRGSRLIVGDTDYSFERELLEDLLDFFAVVYCVNLPSHLGNPRLRGLPLGLESQRYRSAGQMRDFERIPSVSLKNRPIDLLVAWNDETRPDERLLARKILRSSNLVFEVRERVTARYIHHLMRRSRFVICPRGNGLDTHRFWESLYLGAIPIVKANDEIEAFGDRPRLSVRDWNEVLQMNQQELEEIYRSLSADLLKFRDKAKSFIDEIFYK